MNENYNSKFCYPILIFYHGKIYDDYYIIEMKIPLSTFNYPENSKSWRFNFFRFDTDENQRTTWTRIPQEFKGYNLAFMGKLIFERPLKL